jgi:4-hydroxy-tetrahydrodipicolinate reductase
MKIALLGYGKMGKEIEKISLERGHSISKIIDKEDLVDKLTNTDVAINFSTPDSAIKNIKLSLDSSVPIVSGTTGWLENYNEIVKYSKKTNTSFMYSSNFSLGVNLFFELNKKLATLVGNYKDYNINIEEVHHKQKLDKPSGTAITLADQTIINSKYSEWSFDKNKKDAIQMISKREG